MPITPSKAKVACKSCNLRRVRCDRTDRTPCSRCRTAGQDCEPIISKRGKHKRVRIERFGFRYAFAQTPATPAASTGSPIPSSEFQAGLRTPNAGETEGSSAQASNPFVGQSTDIAECQDNRTIYYGDHFNLEYTRKELDDSHEDYTPRINGTCLPHVDRLGSPTRRLVDDHARKERARLDELGAFDSLDSRVSEQLIHTFFSFIYPTAPIIDRKDFFLKFSSGRVSPLLLQAIYLVAFSHCEESLLAEAGFDNRYMAMFTFYQKAKALYDTGFEPDAIAVLQSLCYISFWWESPTQQKDMWYWNGIIVNLAQSLGMHQEKTYSRLDESTRKLWRRIWWSIYSHDIFLAVQLGRIPHINNAYCTTKVLTEQDFEEGDFPVGFNLRGQATKEGRLHLLYWADLCSRVSKCHLSLSQTSPDPSIALRPLDYVTPWKDSLPEELQYRNSTFSLQKGFLASTLNLCFYTFEILLRRNFLQVSQIMSVGTPVFEAAVEIVRILENLLSSGLLTACPLRALPGTFAALSVFIMNMHKASSDISDISAHRARLCMLVLSKLLDHWPPLLLYYPLFARILAARGCYVPDKGIALPAQTQLGETQRNMAPSSTSDGEPSTASGFLMSDSLFNEAEMFGINSMFPFSAFLNEELLDSDLNPSLPVNENISSL
ncbi:fungal-specific transcription factor domain-containing protein [Aspergillus granulosus]|uniref:Fungal-specific transcription factor domain-containing protein n=1 Tax=Aspergillus granulosus TaxID=176169 RepID=A0ABR4HRJ6_9EURO